MTESERDGHRLRYLERLTKGQAERIAKLEGQLEYERQKRSETNDRNHAISNELTVAWAHAARLKRELAEQQEQRDPLRKHWGRHGDQG